MKKSAPKKSAAKPAAAKRTAADSVKEPVVAAPKAAVSPGKADPAPAAPKATKSLKLTKPTGPATIVVRYDAGWGNMLHLRGEGPGLSWDVGTPLCCVKDNEWVWVAPSAGTVIFKVLHNDNAWSLGENVIAAPGEIVTISPSF